MAQSPQSRGSGQDTKGTGVTDDLATRIAKVRQDRVLSKSPRTAAMVK